jgi:hypothetical protein
MAAADTVAIGAVGSAAADKRNPHSNPPNQLLRLAAIGAAETGAGDAKFSRPLKPNRLNRV